MDVRRHRLVRRLGRRADDPATAAATVAATAAVFSALYYGNMALGQLGWAATGRYWPALQFLPLFVLTVANAAAVTWLVWRLAGPSGRWRYRRGAGLGLVVGVASHVGLGVVLAPWFALTTLLGLESGTVPTVGRLVVQMGTVALGSVVFTAGVPLVLSAAAALALTYCRRAVVAAGREEGDRHRWE